MDYHAERSYLTTEDFMEMTKQHALQQAMAAERIKVAAPDLYRELKLLVVLLEPLELSGELQVRGLATLNGARNAIRKAEGR